MKTQPYSTTHHHGFLATLAACLVAFTTPSAQAEVPPTPIYVLTESGGLATATLSAPNVTSTPVAITGLTVGDTLVAIDVRPQNAALYGIGVNATADTLQLYHISVQTGVAVALGTAFSLVSTDGVTMVDFPTAGWDMDFNPAVDRLRVVTETGLNFRLNPNNGAPVDGNLGVAGINPDGSINGGTTTASATAYTNSQPNNGGVTTQYTLDAVTDALYIQNPPNNGTLVSGQTVMLGGAPLDFTSVSGFDIEPGVNALTSNAAVTSGSAYAVLRVGGVAKLYQINLVNAQATEVGALSVQSFAIQHRLGISIGLSSGGTSLLRFSPHTPGTTTTVGITNLTAGETLVALDMRPATGQIYGLGINATADNGTLYLIDPQVGALTVVGSAGLIAYADAAGDPVDLPDPATTGYDIDFNPTVDRLRVVTGSGLNMRVNPLTGAAVDGNVGVANTNTDGNVNGATTSVHATAYTNSFAGTMVTTQYTLDATTDSLYIQNPPNNGTQTSGIPVTLGGSPLDFASPVGFDILGSVSVGAASAPAMGDGYFSATVSGLNGIYRLDLSTGAATLLGSTATSLVSLAMFSISTAPVVTAPSVAGLTPTTATLGGSVDDGGSAITQRGIVISTTAMNASPTLGGNGVTMALAANSAGTFTVAVASLTTGTNYSFRAFATNALGTSYSAVRTFTPPVVVEPNLPVAMVSQDYSFNLNLATGATVTAIGLPPGLKLNPKTGAITGRLTTAGVYQFTLTAKVGGISTSYISRLIVQSLPRTAVGTYLAHILPNAALNGNTAGRIDLTTTSKGSYTLKVIQRAKSYTTTGFLTTSPATTPMLTTTLMGGIQVSLTLNGSDQLTGSLSLGGDMTGIAGWRRIYDKVFYPASPEMGYYTVSIRRSADDIGEPTVPQGSGFASVTIGEDGSTKLVGQGPDGSPLTSAGFLGPNGEIFVHVQLHAKLGSVFGLLTQTNDSDGNYAGNSLSGSLFLTKPATTGRTYPAALSLVELETEGKYLATAATGNVVLGLPSSDEPSTLDFTDGGIEAAAINPDLVNTVTFSTLLKTAVPAPGGAMNPGRTTLTISPASGSVTGTFMLMDGTLKRSVKFQGMIIRRADGSTTANGYFLLPQIPIMGTNTATTSPILSGNVDLIP